MSMTEKDGAATKQGNAGPIIITVHGTFAGNIGKAAPHWWQSEATLATELTKKLGNIAVVEPFIWRDKDGTGPNRESERRIAGRQLFERLSALEDQDGCRGRPYHLVGHSHGGSVIWHALEQSARANKRLRGLRSWTTVATPFIEFGPDGSSLRHLLGAIAAVGILYFLGFWQLAFELAVLVPRLDLPLLIDKLPLSHELYDLHAALGDWLYYALLAGAAALFVFFPVVILFPFKDLFRLLVTQPRGKRALASAAEWYQPLWLGLLHPNDEAMAGLKATLIRSPDLVLRQRRGLTGLLFMLFKPLARPVDEFAWSTLMKNAQGDDIVDDVVRSVSTAPEPFTRGPSPLSDATIASITARADAASAKVLTRLRDRIQALSDQADVAALVGIMSGTYDEDSLIHTSMFDEPAVCYTIVAHIEAATAMPAVDAVRPAAKRAVTPQALIWAKAVSAVAIVGLVAVLSSAAYRILVYPETNLAAAEAILARFNDPTFQTLTNEESPGQAIVRAHRLGIPIDRTLAVAAKLNDYDTQSQAYQLLMRELALTNRMSELSAMVTAAPTTPLPRYRLVDYLTAGVLSALNALARSSPTASPAATQLLEIIGQQITYTFSGDPRRYLLGRLVPVAIAFNSRQATSWMDQVREADPDCKTWDPIITEAAALISKSDQADLLYSIISSCSPKTGAEDRQRMLRRIAIGALRSCDLAGRLLKEASINRAGKYAPVPPRFIECLAHDRKDAANKLATAAHAALPRTSKTEEIRDIWQMSLTLKAAGLTDQAADWAETAIKSTIEPNRQEDKERDTLQQFENDALRLEILAAVDRTEHDEFLAQLSKDAEAFKSDKSRGFTESWAALRYIYAVHADRTRGNTCTIKETDLKTVHTIISIAAYYPDKKPSAVATAILSLADRCKIEMYDGLLAEIVRIVSGNNVSADRARYIAMTAAFQPNLRKAMATAETAALPSDVLKGYVAAVDRHRASIHRQTEYEFNPIKYYSGAAPTTEFRQ